MSMEKNGAISSDTPSPCCGGGACGSEKKGSDPDPSKVELGLKFPTNTAEADAMGSDLTGRLNDSVERASKS
jgi:hypothetical protein